MIHALTTDQIFNKAPSVFAQAAHASRSDRYAFIPTINVLQRLQKEGFEVVRAHQSRTRDETRREFTKHMLRLRHASRMDVEVGGSFAEIVLVNSHDGTSAYNLYGGIFRKVCSNGMCVPDDVIESVHVKHSGNVIDNVIEGSFRVLEDSSRAVEAVANWQSITLDNREQFALAKAAHVLRFGEEEEGKSANPIQPTRLLEARRREDRSNDLWTTFNRVQENVIKGGQRGVRINDETGQRRRVSTRAVTGIDQDVKLNRALWVLAQTLAATKAA